MFPFSYTEYLAYTGGTPGEQIDRSLRDGVRYRRTRKQPREAGVPPMPAGPDVRMAPRSAESRELMQHLEVRAQLEAFQRRHYENWPE